MPAEQPDEEAIFQAARLIENRDARREFVENASGQDARLSHRVESLLQAHESADGFLQSAGGGQPVTTAPVTEAPGSQIGRFKLLQKIGEGGFGVVYMAEQREPVERRVALKIIKPGMDSKQVIARFEAERQALAMMDHPNVARVLDAGTTDSGRPYFVMELVKGVPITQYCDEHQLTPRQRLELFIPVCQAVQHAHQKGIIHRDLKPTNILVAEYDQQLVPKVIDFGIAKAVSQRLTERTMFTEFGQVIGTIEYMSPEQAKLNQLDIDTRSDIYSLGVLLYELLTGQTPFDKKRLHSAAFDEMLRIIREEEPPKPSTRISQMRSAECGARNSSKRGPASPASTPHSAFRIPHFHDLDSIVMKCLEKDRGRRYETASGLARDLERYLADEPVQARPASTAYRLRKFAQRNKAAALATLLIAASLLFGIVISTWQAIRARSAERRAIDAAITAKQAQQTELVLRKDAESGRRETTTQLYRSLVNEATALRLARSPGYRHIAWDRLKQARALETADRNDDVLRCEATRCLGDYLGTRPVVLETFGEKIRGIALDATAKTIAVGLIDGSISVRNAVTGAQLGILPGKRPLGANLTFPLCFDNDNGIISASGSEVTIWKPLKDDRWTGQAIAIEGVATDVASLTNGEIVVLSVPIQGSNSGLRGSSNERVITRISDGTATIASRHRVPGTIGHATFIPHSGLLFVNHSTPDKKRECVCLDTTTPSETVRRFDLGEYSRFKLSQDGKLMLLSGRGSGGGSGGAGTLAVCETDQGTIINSIRDQIIVTGAISPDNNYVAYAPGQLNVIKIWNIAANRQIAGLKCSEQPLDVTFSADGRTLVATNERTVCIWRMDTIEKRLFLGHGALPVAMAFSPHGKHFVSVSHDATLRIWDVETGNLTKVISLPAAGQLAAFSPDGKLLVCAGERFLRVWSAHSWEHLADVEVPASLFSKVDLGKLWALAFSPDGRFLASGGMGLCLWNVTHSGDQPLFDLVCEPSNRYLRHACFRTAREITSFGLVA